MSSNDLTRAGSQVSNRQTGKQHNSLLTLVCFGNQAENQIVLGGLECFVLVLV